MHDRPSAAPARILAERDELTEELFALDGSDERDAEHRQVAAKLEAIRVLIDAQRSVGLDVLLAGVDPDKARAVRKALTLVGAEEIAPAWLCTCCGLVTPIRLRGVPLCVSCATNLVNERDRMLRDGRVDPAWPFPTAGVQCNQRGHRTVRPRVRDVPADFVPNPVPKKTKKAAAEKDPHVPWGHRPRRAPLHGEPAADSLTDRRGALGNRTRDEVAEAGRRLMLEVLGEIPPALEVVPRAQALRPPLERRCPECGETVPPGVARHSSCFLVLEAAGANGRTTVVEVLDDNITIEMEIDR